MPITSVDVTKQFYWDTRSTIQFTLQPYIIKQVVGTLQGPKSKTLATICINIAEGFNISFAYINSLKHCKKRTVGGNQLIIINAVSCVNCLTHFIIAKFILYTAFLDMYAHSLHSFSLKCFFFYTHFLYKYFLYIVLLIIFNLYTLFSV